MSFGLINAAAAFHMGLRPNTHKGQVKNMPDLLDDVIIYSTTIEDRIHNVDEIQSCVAAAGVSLEFKKCSFIFTAVEYQHTPSNQTGWKSKVRIR